MCGIAGADDTDLVNKMVQHLDHRGSSTHTYSDGFSLGHLLHPVIDHVEQPLEEDGLLAANCEIYNWQKLADEHSLSVQNDAELLLKLLDRYGLDVLEEIDGVYAFAYVHDNELVLVRDALGVKPLWYTDPQENDVFAFASEKQALEKEDLDAQELHPRHILVYDLEEKTYETRQRSFFDIDVTEDVSIEEAAEEIKNLFLDAVEKRIPDGEVGLLFSGGVDSTMVAGALQELGKDFTCYTAGIQHGNVNAPQDVEWAEKIADEMDLRLEVYHAELDEVADLIPDIADWISSTSVVKMGVALPFHLALTGDEQVVFSGLGSEQLYAGYNRYEGYLNKECLSGLRRLWQRDLYRDDVIAMRNGYELRLPFLDHDLVEHALTIPGEYKVKDEYRKYVLRKAAEKLGVPEQVAWRKKTAAQYGSNFDKAIGRLAKDNGYDHKQGYLNSFRFLPNHRLAALFSGGKDSNAALYRMARRNNEICCLINLQSTNPDSYMFDTKIRDEIEQQSQALAIPLLVQETQGQKEDELEDLRTAVERAQERYDIDGIIAGALASTYQRDRVEAVADKVGVKVFAPLWQEDPDHYMRWLVREGFNVQITETAARGLDTSWEGTILDDETVTELIALSKEHRFNAAGEGGEYETVVRDGPLFQNPVTKTN